MSVSSQRQAYFNSHAHVERDRTRQAVYKDVVNFNSHAHVERDPFKIKKENIVYNFNSHAHVERDFWELGILNAKKISTHTLTWSVTGN